MCGGSSCFTSFTFFAVVCAAHVADALLLTSSTPASVDSMGNSSAFEAPREKKIAIILRGETFRYIHKEVGIDYRKPCADEAKDVQMTAMTTLMDNVIQPLEKRGNRIEIFFTTVIAAATRFRTSMLQVDDTAQVERCPLDKLIVDFLNANGSRVVKRQDLATTGQADTMLKLVASFNQEFGGSLEKAGANFDYIIIARNDFFWFKHIDEFRANFDRINAISRCEPTAAWFNGGEYCVHDTLWTMPGSLYPIFVSCIGHDDCFDPLRDPNGNGHSCQQPLRNALTKAGHKGAFGWLEDGRLRARGHSEIGRLYAGV